MSLETNVKTIQGDFRRAYEFAEGTWQSSAEVTKDKITKKSLRYEEFYTNNHALYVVENGDAFLYFGSKDNSIFRKDTIDEAFTQLTSRETNYHYRPSPEDVDKAKLNSLKLRISDLELIFDKDTSFFGCFEVDTYDLTGSRLNDTQRKFAEAIYGSMEQDDKGKSDYSWLMQMLNNKGKKGIKTLEICCLRKETVLKDAKDRAIAQACKIYYFGSYSGIYALGDVGHYEALRGVVRPVAKGDRRRIGLLHDFPQPQHDFFD